MSENTCGWCCGDSAPNHQHFTVICRELDGRLLGRLTPDGSATNRKVFAAILSRSRAEEIATSINKAGNFLASVKPF